MLLLLSALLFMSEPVSGDTPPGESSRHTAYTTWLQDDFIRVDIKKLPRLLEMSAKGALLGPSHTHLVVSHQDHGPVFTGERTHTVVHGGNQEPIVHLLSGSGEQAIGEPLGEVQEPFRILSELTPKGSVRAGRARGEGL